MKRCLFLILLAISFCVIGCNDAEKSETAKSLDETAKTLDVTAKSLDETAKSLGETAKTLDVTAKSLDETAKTLDVTAKTTDVTVKSFDGRETREYEVFGMDCPGCHGGLEKLVKKIPAIQDAKANWIKKQLVVTINADAKLSDDDIYDAIKRSNFTVGKRLN